MPDVEQNPDAVLKPSRASAPRLPRKALIGAHEYTISYVPGEELIDEKEEGLLGDTDYDEMTIRIKKELRRSKKQEVLLHECLHACTYPFLNGRDGLGDEDFVNTVAPTLLKMQQDNPELMAYLTYKK